MSLRARLSPVLPGGRPGLGAVRWGAGAVPGPPVPAATPLCGPVRAPHPDTYVPAGFSPSRQRPRTASVSLAAVSALLCLVILEFNICCSEGENGDGSDHCTWSFDLDVAHEQ